jgi:alpha-L-rhamnosidase
MPWEDTLLTDGTAAALAGRMEFKLYGHKSALLAQLEITYTDGSTEEIVTDDKWKTESYHIREYLRRRHKGNTRLVTGWP